MASTPVKLSQQGLTSAINSIRRAKEEYESALLSIERTINGLDGVWQGSAQAAMKNRFEEKRNIFKQFGEEIESYADDMTAFRDDMAERDANLASRIANLG